MALSIKLMNILVCPQCKGELLLPPDDSGLICRACRLKFPIQDDIPIMLIEDAERIGE
jgi:uncharacterized protein YbaR (Trm112 family)